MDTVRFGIIGTGGMGTGHAHTMKNVEEAELTAVCDIDQEVCDRVSAEFEVPGFTEHEALIDSGLVDAVIVATPHYFHPPISIYASAILYNEPLVSPGVEGIRSVEFINALLLSGATGKPVNIPVDREAYEAFIGKKKRTSKAKKTVGPTLRITDPQHRT